MFDQPHMHVGKSEDLETSSVTVSACSICRLYGKLLFILCKSEKNNFEHTAVIEAHPSWCGPCDCVKPILYRVSLDKEDIKFCTAAIDKVKKLCVCEWRVYPFEEMHTPCVSP
jgi:hypothetical protein